MKTKINVEKDWKTAAGLRAVVVMREAGHRCGYVGIEQGSILWGKCYHEDIDGFDLPLDEMVNVHGGLTYAGRNDRSDPVPAPTIWWFGFDCAHYKDNEPGGRSFEYCVKECESLSSQLARINNREE